MSVFVTDPVTDARWAELVERHPRASVFHTPGWLDALRRTYGYETFALTTSSPGTPLESGLAMCGVRSWLDRRLVSLPFSDHCEPLVDEASHLSQLLSFLSEEVRAGKWKRVELRPLNCPASADGRSSAFAAEPPFAFHRLDLSRTPEQIFRRFHASCVQRAIRRAEREGLVYERGRSELLLAAFYHLLRLTRRRHALVPQPLAWFRNLIECLGDRVSIHVASKDGRPVASILTLSFRKTLVYKYGCSDARHHRLGGMPFLFWRAIQDAKTRDMKELDLGRSDVDQPGLIAFKDRLGADRSSVTYCRYPASQPSVARDDWRLRAAGRIFAYMPDSALALAGRALYKHFA